MKIDLFLSDKDKFILNETICEASKGCEFTVTAKKSGKGYVFTQMLLESTENEELSNVQPKI